MTKEGGDLRRKKGGYMMKEGGRIYDKRRGEGCMTKEGGGDI